MPADFVLRGGDSNEASTSYFQTFATAATAYNFVPPIQNQFFVITAIILQANKNVNATTGQVVDIYEGTNATSTTIDKKLVEVEMIKNDRIILTGLNIKMNEGKFLNGKTEDDDVLATVAGYYVQIPM
jgi:hypothetical protein